MTSWNHKKDSISANGLGGRLLNQYTRVAITIITVEVSDSQIWHAAHTWLEAIEVGILVES
jgi:hypothetical protein